MDLARGTELGNERAGTKTLNSQHLVLKVPKHSQLTADPNIYVNVEVAPICDK